MAKLKTVWFIVILWLILCVLPACMVPTSKPTDPLTPTQQLLYSQAIKRGLKDVDVGIPKGASITLEASGLRVDQSLHGDVIHRHMKKVVAGWLGQQGLLIREKEKDSTYRVHLILESLGTTQRNMLLGLPPSNSALLPIATPELAFYKRVHNQGYVRLYFDIFETDSGRLIRSTAPQIGSVTTKTYTVLFFIRWRETDMDLPPPIFQ
jgi:hypothetical protein